VARRTPPATRTIRLSAQDLFVEFLIRVTFGLRYSPTGVVARFLTQRQPPGLGFGEAKAVRLDARALACAGDDDHHQGRHPRLASEPPPPYGGSGICYAEFGDGLVSKVEVNILSGEAPIAEPYGATLAHAAEKDEFAATRRARWFGR